MSLHPSSALVLFSGGQDSATCLAWALARFARVETLGFAYGQRHAVELDCRAPLRAGIAALNGWTLAGGCEMAMGCDIRIIEAHAQIGLPEVKRGMGAKSTTHKLSFLTYLASGLELDWTGDPITAEHAVRLGLASEVVPTGTSLERAKELARQICDHPASYLTYHKERMFQSIGVPLATALATEQRYPPEEGEEYRAGLEAAKLGTLRFVTGERSYRAGRRVVLTVAGKPLPVRAAVAIDLARVDADIARVLKEVGAPERRETPRTARESHAR